MALETAPHEKCQRGDYVTCIFIWEYYMFGLKIGGGGVSGAIFSILIACKHTFDIFRAFGKMYHTDL